MSTADRITSPSTPDLRAVRVVRADALFASPLQRSAAPDDRQVRTAVAQMLRRLGRTGCAAVVASEFGDHPDTAVARMAWVRAAVQATWPAVATTAATPPLPAVPTGPVPARYRLALAS